MHAFKKVLIVLVIVLVGIQFIPTKRNQNQNMLKSDISKTFNTPQNIQNLLKTSCYDCHSNSTKYPWYNKIQPISWFLEKHITEGKKELNFSEFGTYSKRKQNSKLKSIIRQIRDDEMPLDSYTLIHQNAKLDEVKKNELIKWFTKLRDRL